MAAPDTDVLNIPDKKLFSYNAREVAEELCLLDAELLRKIGPSELEGGVWMKKDKKASLAPNVMAMVAMFNQLALLIPTEVLCETTPHARSKVITAFIMIASKCASVRNYNSLKAVLAGLQCTPVHRLTKTWKEVSSRKRKRFHALTKLMSEEENWCLYRKEIECRLDTNMSFIPFLGVYLSDVALSQEARSLAQKKKANPLYDTYTLLEAITIRHRLEKMHSVDDDKDQVDQGDFTHSDSDEDVDTPGKSLPLEAISSIVDKPQIGHDESTHSDMEDVDTPIRALPLLSPVRTPPTLPEWDVTDWLTHIQLQQYAQAFIDNGYETVELCSNLTGTDLTAIGVTNRQHRSTFHTASRQLLDDLPTAHTPSRPLLNNPHTPPQDSPPTQPRSGSLECLMTVVQDSQYNQLTVKSSSTHSLTDERQGGSHKRTLSEIPGSSVHLTNSSETHRRALSDTTSIQSSFSGLPPQLPLHSQSTHRYSPLKQTKSKTELSPFREASVKLKSWISDHNHKGTFPVIRKKGKFLAHTSSSPVLIGRPRRGSATVSRLTAVSSDNPLDWLASFQFQSIGCTVGLQSNEQLRLTLTMAPHNTEAQNYKLSYQLESV